MKHSCLCYRQPWRCVCTFRWRHSTRSSLHWKGGDLC